MTYWNNTGKYQTELDELTKKVPTSGKARELHIDLVRNVQSLVYDHYNNGNCNWDNKREQFAHIEYCADELAGVAKSEGVKNIHRLLADIRRQVGDCLDGDGDSGLNDNWETLTDVVVSWAWQVENQRQVEKE